MKARFGELNHKINMIVIALSHSKTQESDFHYIF
jgi:hypothetical protein